MTAHHSKKQEDQKMDLVVEPVRSKEDAKFELGPDFNLKTISEVIEYRCEAAPKKDAFTYLLDGENDSITWSYQDLKNSIAFTADYLNQEELPGKRVLLLFEPGLTFISAYLATISSGAIAVPCHPPVGTRQIQRLWDMIQNCKPSLILVSQFISAANPQLAQFKDIAHQMGIKIIEVDIPLKPEERDWNHPVVEEEGIAMLQYTSASTGAPKGVIVSQKNLIENCRAVYKWFGAHSARKGCIWLPPYHDMGLLGGILQPLYAGFPLVFMSPMHFVQHPIRWLKAISDHRLTTTGGPNFAFQLCVDQITEDDIEAAELELSCVREIFCGSEPVNSDTMHAFYEKYKKVGLPESAINPGYGLAEATLLVAGKRKQSVAVYKNFKKEYLDKGKALKSGQINDSIRLVSCGHAADGFDIQIVDPETGEILQENQVGEIWVEGPSVTLGYWDNEALTESAFHNRLHGHEGQYYRTGDLGFIHEGQLYVTGRIKEVIIIRGRNLYPQDIERCALKATPLLSGSLAAAFSISNQDTERLVIIVELRSEMIEEKIKEIKERVSAQVASEFNVTPEDVYVGPARTVLCTTSGKIQRNACKEAYLKGQLKTRN